MMEERIMSGASKPGPGNFTAGAFKVKRLPSWVDPNWRDRIKFCPDDLTSDIDTYRKSAAQFCHTCPVKAECLAEAVANEERWGVWGGVDMSILKDRRKAREDSRR